MKTKYTIKNYSEEKIRKSNLYDEIELKNIKIRDSFHKLRDIKANSLKDFVYSNRQIPDHWKKKLDYQNQVFELFAKDENFLLYVGNVPDEVENIESNKSKQKIDKKKILFRNNGQEGWQNKTENNILKNEKIERNNSIRIKSFSSKNIKNKLKHIKNKSIGEKEIINIFDELHNDFPIKEKLVDLFPEKVIKSIRLENNVIGNKLKQFYPEMKPEKRRNIFRQNIFVNLIPQKPKNKSNLISRQYQSAIFNKSHKKPSTNNFMLNSEFVKKKFDIKNELVMKQLESINFFGPYYSYCPSCSNRNIDFYKNLDSQTLVSLVQQIKILRGKVKGNFSGTI
jgi:hypothetical protein